MDRGRQPRERISEKLVAWAWQEGRFAAGGLCSADGRGLQVVYRGRAGDGAGPDFRDAIVIIDGTLRRGDVEIHVRTSDWDAHGHSRDRRYQSVVLHVVLDHDRRGWPIEPPVLELRPWLDAPLTILAELARLEPSGPALCGSFVGWQEEAVAELLDSLGDDRFADKVARAETAVDSLGLDEAVHVGLLDALGVTRNREQMRECAERLPFSVLDGILAGKAPERRLLIAQSMLLGVAGFLEALGDPAQRAVWLEYGDGAPPVAGWELFRIRPANHPARRLLGYGRIVAAAGEAGLFAYLVAGWPVAGVGGLRRRLALPGRDALGAERAASIVLDVLLPIIAARESGAVRRDGHAWHAFRLAPRLADNAITRLMTWQLFAAPSTKLVDRARRQQGLLHLYQTWCRGQHCLDCPVSGRVVSEPPAARPAGHSIR